MINTSSGSFYVGTWDDDLKKLKHYCWVKNQISHEPGCSKTNMCDPEDAVWLDQFYARIMNQTDPLSMYRKAYSSAARRNLARVQTQSAPSYNLPAYSNPNHTPRKKRSYTWILIAAIINTCGNCITIKQTVISAK